MSSKVVCLKIACPAPCFLIMIFLGSGLWIGFRLTFYVHIERAERQVMLTDDKQSYPANNTRVSFQIDSTSITVLSTHHLPYVQVQSVVGLNRTDMWKSLDLTHLITTEFSQHDIILLNQTDVRNKSETIYGVREDQCLRQKLITVSGQVGVILVSFRNISIPSGTLSNCTIRIVVPEGKYVQTTLDYSTEMEKVQVKTSEDPNFTDVLTTFNFEARYLPLLMSGSNQIFFKIPMSQGSGELKLSFFANEEDLRTTLPLVRTSPTSGYVTTWGFDDNRRHPCFMNASRTVHVPLNHEVMVSFSYVDIHREINYFCKKAYIQLYEIENSAGKSLKMEICINSITPALVLNRSVEVRFYTTICQGRGFKMLFSYHSGHETPARHNSGLWDCSVLYYNLFKQHLDCNLEPECQGGEDEGPHCPFSSPACNGSVSVRNKCYTLLTSTGYLSWSSVRRDCRKRGGNLPNVKTEQEQEALNKIYRYGKSPSNTYIGLSTYDGTLPSQYRKVLVWSDGTVAYNLPLTSISGIGISLNSLQTYCFASDLYHADLLVVQCIKDNQQNRYDNPLCEFSLTNFVPQMSVLMPLMNSDHFTNSSGYVPCAEGHFTFDFLSCDKANHCGTQEHPLYCETWATGKSVVTAMFVCLDHSNTLPYSLVCDFRLDCSDGSDETFCTRNHTCGGFRCLNDQCIDSGKLCDVYRDCWDGSDEDCDMFRHWLVNGTNFASPPAVVDFNQQNDLIYKKLNVSDPCPDTHFRCPPDGYCLPIYVRCNGVYDCPYHEDEEDCVSYTCPGFYRCRASSVCVHVDHMCDGRPQCPQHDDELFCELTCPQSCLCQGLAFVCSVRFNTHTFPAMRYLDARGSGMTTSDLAPSIYLVWLSLASCDLQVLTNMSLPSLQTLDLSDNLITWIDMSYFLQFENLRVLRLFGNPLQSLFTSYTAGQSPLTQLDVSRTLLRTFKGDVLSSFPNVQVLNLSFTLLTNLSSDCFRCCPKLTEIDMSGNNIRQIHSETLRHLTLLQTVHGSYYTLCCKEFLPENENLLCIAPFDSFSSCQSLLRSKSLFILLWLLFVVVLVGNVSCAGYELFVEVKRQIASSTFISLMINLNVSDLLMGVYLLVIGVVDEVYRDRYLWQEQSWTRGYLCQVAGLLYFVSTEVSVLTLFLMTMESLFMIRFDGSIFRGSLLPAACCCTWLISLVLAVIPFLPFINMWDLYRQNSVCAPLPVFSDGFVGWPYLFAVVVGLNLVLILTADLLYAGSVFSLSFCISNHTDETRKGEKSLARKLTFLLLAKSLSCSLLSFIGVTTNLGTSYPIDVISSLTLLAGPVNAAVNPALYAFGVLREARRKSQRIRLLKMLQSHCHNPHNLSIFSLKITGHNLKR